MYDPTNDPGLGKIVSIIWVVFILLLFVLFLIFKITNIIDWSWWWITSPLWIPTGLGLLMTLFGLKPK
jgi:hypothetical protein